MGDYVTCPDCEGCGRLIRLVPDGEVMVRRANGTHWTRDYPGAYPASMPYRCPACGGNGNYPTSRGPNRKMGA